MELFREATVSSTKAFKRVGVKDDLKLSKHKTTYIKKTIKGSSEVQELYNSNNELVGIDVIDRTDRDMELIHNIKTGETIVIVQNNRGDKFKGVAICRVGDNYNPTIGHDIAFARANIKKMEALIKECINRTNY